MSRYVIQFNKEGTMRYISHLDLLRLFKRTFKRTGIRLVYSEGFNPHPKMRFVQPLSLGYCGLSEYLELETVEPFGEKEIVSRLNGAMPKGVGIISCREIAMTVKNLAAIVERARYRITMECPKPLGQWQDKVEEFLAQAEIVVEKKQKKSGKMVQVNIRPMIYEMTALKTDADDDNHITLTTLIAAGSNCSLNPEVMLGSFCRFCQLPSSAEGVSVTREDLFYVDPSTKETHSILAGVNGLL